MNGWVGVGYVDRWVSSWGDGKMNGWVDGWGGEVVGVGCYDSGIFINRNRKVTRLPVALFPTAWHLLRPPELLRGSCSFTQALSQPVLLPPVPEDGQASLPYLVSTGTLLLKNQDSVGAKVFCT